MEERQPAAGPRYDLGQQAAQLEQQQQQQQSAGSGPPQAAVGNRHPYSDEFMMYVWKVEMCRRIDKHDRELCPDAHPGELARRRHPSLYQALPCPEARAKKICPRLENCNCSHSTFEFWLHPDRYKTFLCERGDSCNRPICFFAHRPEELRELPQGLQRTQPAPRHHTLAPGSGSSSQQVGTGQLSAAGGQPPTHHRGAAAEQAGSSASQHRALYGTSQGRVTVMVPPSMDLAAAPAASPAGAQPGVWPEPPRGTTVAVIPAGPSTWQNNVLLQAEPGEAPNLEELCAAMTRMGPQRLGEGADALALQQQAGVVQPRQIQQQTGGSVETGAVVAPHYPVPLLGPQAAVTPFAHMPFLATQPQQQQQQAVMLPGGQLLYVQMSPQGDGSAGEQLPWGRMQSGG